MKPNDCSCEKLMPHSVESTHHFPSGLSDQELYNFSVHGFQQCYYRVNFSVKYDTTLTGNQAYQPKN